MRAEDSTPNRSNQITIAIDGFSSCGKSTLARDLADKLGYLYIDSGAMYRAVTLYFIQNSVDIDNMHAVDGALEDIDIQFREASGKTQTFLNGINVERDIRTMEVSKLVSPVAALSNVRKVLVSKQRQFNNATGVVMDGRDIGTVVFPDAELKLFVTASLEERIRRRSLQLKECGIEASEEEVERSITERDRIDTTRVDSPLRQASDAIVLDNTNLTRPEQLEVALSYVDSTIGH